MIIKSSLGGLSASGLMSTSFIKRMNHNLLSSLLFHPLHNGKNLRMHIKCYNLGINI